MVAATVSFLDAVLGLALIVIGPLSAHFYLLDPMIGLDLFLIGALLSVLGLLTGLVGLFVTRRPENRSGRPRALVGAAGCAVLIVVAIVVPVARASGRPPINDITTDFEHPPAFVHAAELAPNRGRDMSYDRARCEKLQLKGYGDLAPLKLDLAPGQAYPKVQAAAASMPDWRIAHYDETRRFLEGVATSPLFRFEDDFVIEVRDAPGGGSLVEMRSKSRHGVGDLGANYRRIRSFFAKLSSQS
jgi:uncharacterized protein (DUF1499 family)